MVLAPTVHPALAWGCGLLVVVVMAAVKEAGWYTCSEIWIERRRGGSPPAGQKGEGTND
jgi:hypothetical protein